MSVLKIGHRGACGYELENTIASFKKAIELKVDMIEFDVYKCKTGEIIVMHDETINRTTNGIGKVKDLTFEELKKFKMKNGEEIPTLDETLNFINKRCRVNIEIKDKNSFKTVARIIKKFIEKKNWPIDFFLVSSFRHEEIKKFKKIFPEIKVSLLSVKTPFGLLKKAEYFKAETVAVDKYYVDLEFVNKAHENNINIFVYTVNEPSEIQNLKEIKVDGIFSNFPDRI